MTASLVFAITDWITWPLIFGICVLFAIWKKNHVRAVLKLNKFQFSLDAKGDRKPKAK